MYKDPQYVAIRSEEEHNRKEAACGECRNRVSFHWYGEEIVNCDVRGQRYGKRCEHYRKKFVIENED